MIAGELDGVAATRLRQDGQRYDLRLVVSAFLIGSRSQSSEGDITPLVRELAQVAGESFPRPDLPERLLGRLLAVKAHRPQREARDANDGDGEAEGGWDLPIPLPHSSTFFKNLPV